MTDVTAQAFREAAATAEEWWEAGVGTIDSGSISDFFYRVRPLLLAAAEQREQVEKFVDLHARQMRVKDGVIEANGIIREGLEKQIAALLELNEADNRTQAAYHAQVATLTAERDEYKAKFDRTHVLKVKP